LVTLISVKTSSFLFQIFKKAVTLTDFLMATPQLPGNNQNGRFQERAKEHDVRSANIIAAKGVADAVRSSLGPKGMDKMIQSKDGEVIITNDGATIMSHIQVFHPTAKMLVELSKSQDIEAGEFLVLFFFSFLVVT
jgi:T-complex protein 1 subunit delta